MSDIVEIYTDGACKSNPGVGGWGALMRCNGREKEIFGGERVTTNNRMEMTAVIQALTALKQKSAVKIYTDSKYVQLGITEWIENWERCGWRTANNRPVKNADLWRILADLTQGHQIEWIWVRGHNGHDENERADELANRGVQLIMQQAS